MIDLSADTIMRVAGGDTLSQREGASRFAQGLVAESFAFLPDGSITYVGDDLGETVKVVAKPGGLVAGGFNIPAASGDAVYRFDDAGRHEATYDTGTGVAEWTFGYDASDLLVSMTDRDGLVTTIERDGTGKATAIVGPYGDRTTLDIDATEHLITVTNAENEAHHYEYDRGHLLTAEVDPKGNRHEFTYDDGGKLITDRAPNLGATTLEQLPPSGFTEGYTRAIRHTTPEGLQTKYELLQSRSRVVHRTIGPDGLVSMDVAAGRGESTSTSPDGTLVTVTSLPDDRLGFEAGHATVTTKLPSGLTRTTIEEQESTGAVTTTPWVVGEETTRMKLNGKTMTLVRDNVARTITATTPEGRVTTTHFDVKDGRPRSTRRRCSRSRSRTTRTAASTRSRRARARRP